MLSYLADGVVLVALLVTSYRMATIHRELKRLRNHEADYRRVFAATTSALESIRETVQEINLRGCATLSSLEGRIEEAKELIAALDEAERREPVLAHRGAPYLSSVSASPLVSMRRVSVAAPPQS